MPADPALRHAFIGRQHESALLVSLLHARPAEAGAGDEADDRIALPRLVTLIGPGGVGKTRLAREVMRVAELSNERATAFVSLATIATADQAPGTIARALGNQLSEGLLAWQALARSLAERPWLLVLDNLEHLADLAAPLARLLAAAPDLTILATSRHAIGVPGERIVPVAPLPIQPTASRLPGEDATRSPAAHLFLQAARHARPSFEPAPADLATIEAICARVDGLPLAIEIVAAQIRNLSPRAILAALDSTPDSLIQLPIPDDPDFPDDAATGHRQHEATLTDMMARTARMLPAREQALFHRLALLPAGITPALAAALDGTGDSVLPALLLLCDRSLLVAGEDTDGTPRFSMLETVRAYAAVQLARATAAERREAAHRLVRALTIEAEDVTTRRFTPDGPAALDRLDREFDSIRALLDRWLGSPPSAPPGEEPAIADLVRLVVGLEPLLLSRGHVPDGRRWASALLARVQPDGDEAGADALATLTLTAGRLATMHGDYDQALAQLEPLMGAGDGAVPDAIAAWARFEIGTIRRSQGALELGYPLLLDADAAFQAAGNTLGLIRTRNALGVNRMDAARFTEAERWFTEALRLARSARNGTLEATALLNLGYLATLQAQFPRAIAIHEQCQALCEQTGDLGNRAMNMINLAGALIGAGDLKRADALEEEALRLMRRLGNIWGEATALYARAAIARRQGNLDRERALLMEQLPLRRAIGNPGPLATNLLHLSRMHREAGNTPGADLALDEAATLLDPAVRPGGDAVIAFHRALAAWYAGAPGATRALRAALARLHRARQGLAQPTDLREALAFLAESTQSAAIARLANTPEPTLGALRAIAVPAWADLAPAPPESDPLAALSAREADVLRLVAAGKTDRQIADALFISPRTAGFHVSNILHKLGLATRAEAAAWAARQHLG